MLASLDRQISLWDLTTGVCVAKLPSFQIVNFACIGSYFPAAAYSYDASLAVPSTTIVDFVCSGMKLTMPVTNSHGAVVWAISINPWTGEFLLVDDVGKVSRACPSVLDGMFDSKRKKYVEEVVMKSLITSEGEDEVYDYAEARRRAWIRFTYSNKLPSRMEVDKDFKEDGLTGRFPLAALFTAAWNLNTDSSRWVCFGGQNGLLHVRCLQDVITI